MALNGAADLNGVKFQTYNAATARLAKLAGAIPVQIEAAELSQALATGVAVRVECYAGYKSEETPRHFHIGERRVEVVEVLDTWLTPEHGHYKVKGSDDATYVLRHDAASGA